MRIAVIGNATYDYIVSKRGFIIEDERNDFYDPMHNAGGPALNAAFVISKFKNDVDFYGQIGNDDFGKAVYEELKKTNINLDHLVVSDKVPTPFSYIVVNTEKDTRTICTSKVSNDYGNPHIGSFSYRTDYDFILTDGKYASDSIALIIQNPNAVSIIDAGRVNSGTLKLCKYVNYIICSENFANEVTKMKINDNYENNVKVYNTIKAMFPKALGIAITVGPRGYICEKDGSVVNMPSYYSGEKVVETNGAGDIFHGAFTHAMANGYDYYDALEFANVTASLSTTKTGGKYSCPDLDKVKSIIGGKKLTLKKK